MPTTVALSEAEDVIARLRTRQPELRSAGVLALSLFGSLARGEATNASDVDLAVVFDPAVRMDLVRLAALEAQLAQWLGRRVDLVPEPARRPRLQAGIDRDRRRVF